MRSSEVRDPRGIPTRVREMAYWPTRVAQSNAAAVFGAGAGAVTLGVDAGLPTAARALVTASDVGGLGSAAGFAADTGVGLSSASIPVRASPSAARVDARSSGVPTGSVIR